MPSAYAECLRGREPPWFLGGGVAGVFGQRQGAEGSSGLGFTDGGEVKVDEGGLEGSVTEVGGDLTNVGTAFQKVGGEAVTQSVDDELEMFFAETAFHFSELEGSPGATVVHGFTTVMEGLLEGNAGAFPATSGCGKEPVGIAMPLPEGAKS